ncbi:MAG: hypothetical protein ABJA57_00370 [Ginsengibacter sp.]
MKKLILSIILATTVCMGSIQAQIVKHEKYQHKRIRQGVRNGEITPAERKRLALQQKDIHQDVKEAKADGVVTPVERKEIREDQAKANRSIYRKKHNVRDRK